MYMSSSGNDESSSYRYDGYEDNSNGRISNKLPDESVAGFFEVAVSNSPLNKNEALEEAICRSVTKDDNGVPTLKSDLVQGYSSNGSE